MATRQYIGARYVPKFYENSDGTSDWRSGVIYEPLTVVTYNSNSYTSKKAVPASVGNPSDNPSYWAPTGNYNQQVEEYRQEVEGVKADIDILKKASRKHVVILGDSYGDESSEYPTILQESMNFEEFYPLCTGGHGFTGKENTPAYSVTLKWITDLTNWVNSQTETVLNGITDLYIIGGFNDHYVSSANVILTEMQTLINYARQHLINAEIHVGFLGWCGLGDVTASAGLENGATVREKLRDTVYHSYSMCTTMGATFIDGLNSAIHNYKNGFDATNYHPTRTGEERVARLLAQYIISGQCNIYDNAVSSLNLNNLELDTANGNLIGNASIDNGIITIKGEDPTQFRWLFSSLSAPARTITRLGKITGSGCILHCRSVRYTTMPVMISTETDSFPGYVCIDKENDAYIYGLSAISGNNVRVFLANTSFSVLDV